METLIDTMRTHSAATWIIAASVCMFFGSIALAWLYIVKMPADYLTKDSSQLSTLRSNHPVVGLILTICRNALGVLIVICGIIMLFIPGQGVLFIFLGLTLINFPGKKELIRKMLSWKNTLKVINQIRRKAGKSPIESPVTLQQST